MCCLYNWILTIPEVIFWLLHYKFNFAAFFKILIFYRPFLRLSFGFSPFISRILAWNLNIATFTLIYCNRNLWLFVDRITIRPLILFLRLCTWFIILNFRLGNFYFSCLYNLGWGLQFPSGLMIHLFYAITGLILSTCTFVGFSFLLCLLDFLIVLVIFINFLLNVAPIIISINIVALHILFTFGLRFQNIMHM